MGGMPRMEQRVGMVSAHISFELILLFDESYQQFVLVTSDDPGTKHASPSDYKYFQPPSHVRTKNLDELWLTLLYSVSTGSSGEIKLSQPSKN